MNPFHLALHGAMLADASRNEALALAIEATVRPGDVVVDVGAGTGLLSMLAAQAGARRVFALEATVLAIATERIVERNGLSGIVKVHRTRSQCWEPPEPADVILCETLGFVAFEEGFRATLVDARTRLLKPGGRIIPSGVRLMVAPTRRPSDTPDLRALGTICGLDYSDLAPVLAATWQRVRVTPGDLLGAPVALFEEDCARMPVSLDVSQRLRLPVGRSGLLGGVAMWFEADLFPGVVLDGGRTDYGNHWGQALLGTAPMEVRAGDTVVLDVSLFDNENGLRLRWSAVTTNDRPTPSHLSHGHQEAT